MNFRDTYKISLITIRRTEIDPTEYELPEEHIIGVPENSEIVRDKDIFVLFGKSSDIDIFINANL